MASWYVYKEVVWNHESYDFSLVEQKQSQGAPTTEDDQTHQKTKEHRELELQKLMRKGKLTRLKILRHANISLGIQTVGFRIPQTVRELPSAVTTRCSHTPGGFPVSKHTNVFKILAS